MTDTATLPLEGEVDVSTVGAIREAIDATTAPTVVLDAAGLTFIDSSGLNMLLEAKDRLTAEFRILRIINRPRVLNRLLDMTGLGEEFN